MNPLVSIIVPCYNQAEYLDESLQSVLDQTYSNWECIIVNDGSPDNTGTIAQRWCKNDSRFKYIYQKNFGVSSARNLGISKAGGEFILPLDADDKISPDYIELAVINFQKDNTLKLVYCKAQKFGEEEGVWDLKPFSLFNLSQKNMIFCSSLFRKNEWERVGGYDENMISGIEDWEFWIAILKGGGAVKCLNIQGFYYRVKSVSRHKQFDECNEKHLLEYMSVKHADFFVEQLGAFTTLYRSLEEYKNDHRRKLKSKKYVLNLFCQSFFGISLFKTGK
ncbi:MAG: glycosyltransferase family 2 protein [Flavobacterium sp.]